MIELSRYAFESLRTDQEFILYRARRSTARIRPGGSVAGGGERPFVGREASFTKASDFAEASSDRSEDESEHKDLSSILVLAPALEQPELGTLKRLEHECSLRDELDPEWAVRPIGLTHHWDRSVLVLQDPGGEPLEQFLGLVRNPGPHSLREALQAEDAGGQPMELGRFLRLAMNLAAGLDKLHRRGLMHKDIKPAHILVDLETNKVWFTGFGISSRLASERQAAEPPEVIAGTLPYMAPEQTGRMNRSIDSRSDLYSLGVTFYQMLTGVLPFTASDPMEWVHCHVARQPVPLSEKLTKVPDVISALCSRACHAKLASAKIASKG